MRKECFTRPIALHSSNLVPNLVWLGCILLVDLVEFTSQRGLFTRRCEADCLCLVNKPLWLVNSARSTSNLVLVDSSVLDKSSQYGRASWFLPLHIPYTSTTLHCSYTHNLYQCGRPLRQAGLEQACTATHSQLVWKEIHCHVWNWLYLCTLTGQKYGWKVLSCYTEHTEHVLSHDLT